MTAFIEFFCDYCNASGQRPEVSEKGYARELLGNFPLGWWEVPKKGPGGHTGHACPECVMGKSDVREDIAQRRGLETKRLLGELDQHDEESLRPTHDKVILDKDELESDDPAPDWPARTSPFDG